MSQVGFLENVKASLRTGAVKNRGGQLYQIEKQAGESLLFPVQLMVWNALINHLWDQIREEA